MKKRTEGQAFKKAVFATAHKLIRVIFAMLTQKDNVQGGLCIDDCNKLLWILLWLCMVQPEIKWYDLSDFSIKNCRR